MVDVEVWLIIPLVAALAEFEPQQNLVTRHPLTSCRSMTHQKQYISYVHTYVHCATVLAHHHCCKYEYHSEKYWYPEPCSMCMRFQSRAHLHPCSVQWCLLQQVSHCWGWSPGSQQWTCSTSYLKVTQDTHAMVSNNKWDDFKVWCMNLSLHHMNLSYQDICMQEGWCITAYSYYIRMYRESNRFQVYTYTCIHKGPPYHLYIHMYWVVTEAKICCTNLTGWMTLLSALSVTPPEDSCSEGDPTKQLNSMSQPLFADVDKQLEPWPVTNLL